MGVKLEALWNEERSLRGSYCEVTARCCWCCERSGCCGSCVRIMSCCHTTWSVTRF